LDNNCETLIHKQFDELAHIYPSMSLFKDAHGYWVVQGDLHFSASYNGTTIEDKFSIILSLPQDYPKSPPTVQETGGRIPKDIDYHVFPRTGNLCLGAPLDVRLKFQENPFLLHFVNKQVISFLFAFSHKECYGKDPFDDLPHGGKGILEYYTQLFNVTSNISAVELLKILAENNYRGHYNCLCGSGKRLRDCHGGLLKKITVYQSQDDFIYDYVQCLTHLQKSGQQIPRALFSKKITNRLNKYGREFDKNEKREVTAVQNSLMNLT
jgi:hypothetical protein